MLNREPEKKPECRFLKTRFRQVSLTHPLWMGIVNAAPDSFSDGGRYDPVSHAFELLSAGADILDIGGESTRPGSSPVTFEEEIRRITPVLDAIQEQCAKAGFPKPFLSVDTYHWQTARYALAHGVEMLNDISGMEDPRMIQAALDFQSAVCFMHKQGTPQTMQDAPQYENVVEEVYAYLAQRRDALLAAGIEKEKLAADPGIGFGKTLEQNWELVENAYVFQGLGIPVLIGHSRKRFLDKLCNQPPYPSRDEATQTVSRQLIQQNVQILRTHVSLFS